MTTPTIGKVVCGPSIEPLREWRRNPHPLATTGAIDQALAAYDALTAELSRLRSENERLKGEVKSEREYSESLAKDICKMEDALGFKNDCHDNNGAFVPTIGPWLERLRDLIASEGELGDHRDALKKAKCALGCKIGGFPLREYLHMQFPATVGNLLLSAHLNELEQAKTTINSLNL